MAKVPEKFRWVFWDVDAKALDTATARNYIIPRVLEFGRLEEVRWLIRTYGMNGIHRFLREVGHPELSARTLGFWRAVLKAEGEVWASSPDWRRNKAAPWVD
ncbi:hypothetical protein WME98_27600 [Sorangium sp. So ce296]|uniref:DUF6922 domain-containing protein n=1 Tax=Sorangium sp. So ce296 TaxID=3133296 RepID=UPI003F5F9E77